MLGRSSLVLICVCSLGAGANVGCSHRHCGDGGMSVQEGDGGFVCVGGPEDGGAGQGGGGGRDGAGGAGGEGGTGGSGGTGGTGGAPPPDGALPFCGDGLCNGSETCS